MKKSSLNYSKVFNQIIEQIKENKILFSCSQCLRFLFCSSNVTSIFILKEKYYCFVLSNFESECRKVGKEQKIEDTFLKLNDTLYSEVTCKCGELLGNKLLLTNYEHSVVCNSIFVRND